MTVDWKFTWAFVFGQFLATWHYASLLEATVRSLAILVLYVVLAKTLDWIDRLPKRHATPHGSGQ